MTADFSQGPESSENSPTNGTTAVGGTQGAASPGTEATPLYPPTETLITSLPEKLPAEVRSLWDETLPLPPGVTFFEERFTAAVLAKRGLMGLALLAVGVLAFLFGLSMLFGRHRNATVYSSNDGTWQVLGVGAVFGFAGWLMVYSIPACLALGRQQRAGRQTRYGLFLMPEAQVWRSYFDTTVIPRAKFHHLENRTLHYITKTGVKTFALPPEWIGAAPDDVLRAIASWTAAATSSVQPPPLPPSTATAAGSDPSAV